MGELEIGYLFGQYKRINMKGSSNGKPFLTTGPSAFSKVRHGEINKCTTIFIWYWFGFMILLKRLDTLDPYSFFLFFSIFPSL